MGDTDAGVGLCYGCNKMHTLADNGPRARRLIKAVYEVLGWRDGRCREGQVALGGGR
jgi:hypothetical protein